MLKLPKGLKKKKKGKKSKRKGEDELFTEEELEKYRKEHQKQECGNNSIKENEEWSKFKDLTSGVDTVLKKTQGDLDRIKSTSFFQRVEPKEVETKKEAPQKPAVEITVADFPHLAQAIEADNEDKSEYGITDDDSEEEEQDDIFDTSYVDAIERGEVKLAYVPDSPDEIGDDDLFDTSHVDALIRGQETKSSKGKKALDIGVAVEVLTGRIDNLTVKVTKKTKRIIPGDLLLENTDKDKPISIISNPEEKSILDIDADIPITSPIDLSVSLHTSLLQQDINKQEETTTNNKLIEDSVNIQDEIDEFTLLAAESLESGSSAIKLSEKEIKVEPILQEAWSAFEADKNDLTSIERIDQDQINISDPYADQDDPFDTSFADAVVFLKQNQGKNDSLPEEDDDFDPRADEINIKLNNRRKSSVRIHLINPCGLRESITSDEVIDKEDDQFSRDLLGGSTTDLTTLSDSPLYPRDISNTEIDPFDTTIVDKIVAPGKVELKLLEQELIGGPKTTNIYRVPSDPDFDPRADEPKKERRASRPENLVVSKSVVFNIENNETVDLETVKSKPAKPLTPYYFRELSITEDIKGESESSNVVSNTLVRTHSDENLAPKANYQTKRRHSEYSQPKSDKGKLNSRNVIESEHRDVHKILTPIHPLFMEEVDEQSDLDPFDTSFATGIVPSKIELKLLAKEFSCEEPIDESNSSEALNLLEPSDDIFQVKALTPEPSEVSKIQVTDFDPFDTSFTGNLNPGKTELKLLESEFLN